MRTRVRNDLPQAIVALLGALALIASQGCESGPNYQQPTDVPANDWSRKPEGSLASGQASLERWWEGFHDPVLDQLLARVRDNNQDLAKALANVQVAYAKVGVSESQFWPAVGAGAQLSYLKQNASTLAAAGVELNPYSVYAWGAQASWEIDLWGKVARQVEAATASAESQVDILREALVSLRAQAAANYMQVRMLQAELQVTRDSIEVFTGLRDLVKAKLAAGTATILDLNRAQAQLDLATTKLPSLENNLSSTQNTLAVLCGTTVGQIEPMLAQDQPIPTGPGQVGVGVPADLLRRRADVRAAERELAAATANIGAFEALYLPQLAISGNWYLSAPTLGGLGSISNQNYSIGPSVSWLIFQGGYVQSLVWQSKAQMAAALAGYRQSVLGAIADVERSMVALNMSRVAESSYDDAVANVEVAAGLARLQYAQGVTSLSNLLDVENQLLSVRSDQVQNEGLVAQNLVGLYRALGGGWEESSINQEAETATKRPTT